MSVYTTELRWYLMSLIHFSVDEDNVEEIVEQAEPIFFDDIQYSIFDEVYRHELNKKILRHFFFREIGFETVGLFKNRFKMKMIEIMPYYNALLKVLAESENIFANVDYTITGNNTGNSNTKDSAKSNSSTKSTSDSINKYSDTPQGALTDIESNEYLTNATIDNNSGQISTETAQNSNSDRNYVDNTKVRHLGKNGGLSYAEMIRAFSEKSINIDQMIMMELDSLFMMVY